jgi:hypothetical protein
LPFFATFTTFFSFETDLKNGVRLDPLQQVRRQGPELCRDQLLPHLLPLLRHQRRHQAIFIGLLYNAKD